MEKLKMIYVSPLCESFKIEQEGIMTVSVGSPDIFDNDNGDEDEVWS